MNTITWTSVGIKNARISQLFHYHVTMLLKNSKQVILLDLELSSLYIFLYSMYPLCSRTFGRFKILVITGILFSIWFVFLVRLTIWSIYPSVHSTCFDVNGCFTGDSYFRIERSYILKESAMRYISSKAITMPELNNI